MQRKKRGFSLLESIFAMWLATIISFSTMVCVTSFAETVDQNKVQAMLCAREVLETLQYVASKSSSPVPRHDFENSPYKCTYFFRLRSSVITNLNTDEFSKDLNPIRRRYVYILNERSKEDNHLPNINSLINNFTQGDVIEDLRKTDQIEPKLKALNEFMEENWFTENDRRVHEAEVKRETLKNRYTLYIVDVFITKQSHLFPVTLKAGWILNRKGHIGVAYECMRSVIANNK